MAFKRVLSLVSLGGTLKDMGKIGLPILHVLIPDGKGHDMNAIFTGTDATKFEDWNFVEPQFDQINVKPGQAYIPKNCEVIINYTFKWDSSSTHLSSTPIIKFKVENGIGNLVWINNNQDFKIITKR